MSGECDNCHQHTLECACRDSFGGVDPPDDRPPIEYVNVNGRIEHESIIKNAMLCKELGLDQAYEIMVYLRRWGGWLGD